MLGIIDVATRCDPSRADTGKRLEVSAVIVLTRSATVLMELRSIGGVGILLGQGLSWCRHCSQEDLYGMGAAAQAALEAY